MTLTLVPLSSSARALIATVLAAGAFAVAAPALARPVDAPWLHYRCDNGSLKVRYRDGRVPAAEVRLPGRGAPRVATLRRVAGGPHAETLVFRGGNLRWSLDRPRAGAGLRTAGAGFLARSEVQTVNGRRVRVDNLLRKGCEPAR